MITTTQVVAAVIFIAIVLMFIVAIFLVMTIRLQEHDDRFAELSRRIEDIAEAGKINNAQIRELVKAEK